MKLPSIAKWRVLHKAERHVDSAGDRTRYDMNRIGVAKALEDVAPLECHWPLNNGNPFLFCAAPVASDTYCEEHLRRSLQHMSGSNHRREETSP